MNIPIYYTLKQCDIVTVESASMPYMKSLHSILNRVIGDGYAEDFSPVQRGLLCKSTNKVYRPEEIAVVNTFRFEGNSNPADNVVMYMIETTDGLKGTLVSASGTSEEEITGSFLRLATKKVPNLS